MPTAGVRVVDLKTGSSKPSADEVARHGQLGAYQLAVEAGGARRARHRLRRRGPPPARPGRQQVHDPPGPATARRRPRARTGRPTSSATTADAMGAATLHGDPRLVVRDLPAPVVLPGPRGGEAAVSSTSTAVRWTAVDLARALGQPYAPTAEQARVIEAPLRPAPRRRRRRLGQDRDDGRPRRLARRQRARRARRGARADLHAQGRGRARPSGSPPGSPPCARPGCGPRAPRTAPPSSTTTPTVSTYHSYAGGHRPRARAAPRRRAREPAAHRGRGVAVRARGGHAWDGPMDEVDKAESTVTTAVVDLAGEMAEHLVDADARRRAPRRRSSAPSRPCPGGTVPRKRLPSPVRDTLAVLRERARRRPPRRALRRLKRDARRDGLRRPDGARGPARVDRRRRSARPSGHATGPSSSTSSRTPPRPSSSCCARCSSPPGEPVPVTAVGDPHQSIYGWRGASSTTLDRFRADFADPEPARVRHLSTSWRNDRAVLDVANHVAAPLAATSRVPVESLAGAPGRRPRARRRRPARHPRGRGRTTSREWLRRTGAGCPVARTAAVLCRKRSQFAPVVEALEERGMPHEVVGLGGLLHTPEVADLVALLWVVQDPTRGDHLMRLLTGPVLPARRRRPRRAGGVVARAAAAAAGGRGGRPRARRERAGEHRRGARRPARRPRWVGDEGQRHLAGRPRAGSPASAAAVRRLRSLTGLRARRARRRGRDRPRARHRGARPPRLQPRRRPRPPRRLRRRRRAASRRAPTAPRSAASSPGSTPPSTRSAGSTSAGSRPVPTPCR